MKRRIIAIFAGILCMLGLTAVAANAATNPGGGWGYPAPAGLASSGIFSTGYALSWKAPVSGTHTATKYTVNTFQMNGVVADEFTTSKTTALEYGKGGKGLHPGWEYATYVWANGGTLPAAYSGIDVNLPNAPTPTPTPTTPTPTPTTPTPTPTTSTPPPTTGYTVYADNPSSGDDVSSPPLTYAGICGSTCEIQVYNDVWSPPEAAWSQSVNVANAGNWYAAANFPTDTSVHSFANVGQIQDWIGPTTKLPAKTIELV